MERKVIIPNGDLVSQHVINWTLSNNQRRVEIIVRVKYGSDLNKVKGDA
jgi:small-conductance mechanosensitive channel